MLSVDSYDEYRLRGCSDKRGPWEGTWRRGEPSKNERYDARETAKRNEDTWWEFRTVTISDERREDVD